MNDIDVLVVEDEEIWQDILRDMLLTYGCEVDVAGNYQEASRKLDERPYDIVTLDMSLGPVEKDLNVAVSSGWRLLVIRLRKEFPATKVIVISESFKEDLERIFSLKELGVNDFMTKTNFTPEKLEKLVQESRKKKEAVPEDPALVVQCKQQAGEYDVFLCYNPQDRALVEELGTRLKDKGILPWLDIWELRPGMPWQTALEERIEHINAAAVFIGPAGISPWQDTEIAAFLREFISRNCPVIPVILQGCDTFPKLPLFLKGMTWVNFGETSPDPMLQLVWGITGKKE